MTLTAYSLAEFLELPPPEWLIEGVLPVQGLIALYGQPGDGKTFIALDMALSIASGRDWQGHPVKKGCVVYISAEGGGGLSKRVGAWLAYHKVRPSEYQDIFANFIVSAIRIHPESEDLGDLIVQTVEKAEYRWKLIDDCINSELPIDPNDTPDPPLFVVVDTLSRCFEGDENQQEDMGNFIKGLDWLRQEHGATVEVVHHTNKSSFDERGSSVFRGACDTMMLVSKKENDITLKCTKQKDYEEFGTETFELVVVPEWNSCVIESSLTRINKEKALIVEYLQEFPNTPIREIALALGLSKSVVHRRIQEIRTEQNEGEQPLAVAQRRTNSFKDSPIWDR